MNYGISVTVDLTDLDKKTIDLFDEGYHEKIIAIEEDLLNISGVEQVMFNHMSWIKVEMGTDDFFEAAEDMEILTKEIAAVFEKHGVK